MGGWTRNSCGSWKGFLTRFGSSAPGVKRSPKRVPSRLVLWLMCPPLFMCQRIRQVRPGNLRAAFVLAGLMAFFALHQARALNQLEPGLAITFTTADSGPPKTSDVTVLPNVQLYVPADTPPTPFLPGGRFSADWVGFISSEIRDNYTFQADLNGDLKLEINGAPVWEAAAKGTNAGPGKPVRINKGTNAFKVRFASPSEGDAWVQLDWSSKEFAPEPIALNA